MKAAGHARAALLVALVAAALVLPRLGHRQIIGSHEAVFPLVARDIVNRHDWLNAELRGHPYRNKPPLYPWTIAVVSWPFGGVSETTARLPGALAAIGAVVATFALGTNLFGRRVGVSAALILLTSVVFFDHALATIPDVPMLFFGLLGGLALWSIANDGGWRARLGFYLALALGVFTKGIPGLMPLAVALVWLAADGGRPGLRRLVWWPGILVFASATALWLVPHALGDVNRYAVDVIWRDSLRDHIGGPRLGSLGTELAYAVLGFLPWTLVLPLALVAALRDRRTRPVGFALGWFVVQDVLVLAVQQQRVRYLLPLLPGAALLVAWWADREASAPRARPGLAAAALVVALSAVVAMPLVLRHLAIELPAPRWQIAAVLVGIVALGTAASVGFWTGRLAPVVPAVAALSALLLMTGGWMVDDWANRAWDYRRAAAALAQVSRPLAVAALADDHELLQVDFYLGRSLPPLRSPEAVARHLMRVRGAVVVEEPRWRSASQWLPIDATTLSADVGAGVVVVTEAAR